MRTVKLKDCPCSFNTFFFKRRRSFRCQAPHSSLPLIGSLILALGVVFASGCATQSKPLQRKEAQYSLDEQKRAQQQAMAAQEQKSLGLKRKIALGRISNETLHGKSLLRDQHNDVLGKQVTDMLAKALTESGNFIVLERPDITRLQEEAALSNQELNIVGADALLIGSLTEFGRNTTGESGFLSSSKKQSAVAKIDLRLVDAKTGHVLQAFSGAGEADTETVNVAGFGSKASYDATLNDRAVSAAVADVVNELTTLVSKQPWQSDVLTITGNSVFISGGEAQGVKEGMEFDVLARGNQVKSKQTGFVIQLPSQKVARVRVTSLFGKREFEQGAVAEVVAGSLAGYDTSELIVQEIE